jgi:hypothetical protein
MQAIMLLASGSTTSSSCKDPSGNGVSAHPLSSPIPQSTPSSSVSPPPQATTTATAAPSSIHANILPRSIARSVHAGKCSLSNPKGRLLKEVCLECLQLTSTLQYCCQLNKTYVISEKTDIKGFFKVD